MTTNANSESTKNSPPRPTPPATTTPEPYTIFTRPQKALILLLVSVAATLGGFASNIYFPAIPTVASDLGVSTELINLTVTVYLIFQGLSPTVWGALSDAKGRRVTYICTLLVFIGACIGLAETRSYAQLMVLRCLQSTGSASTIAIGAGVVGDVTTRAERGGYMGVYQAGTLLPVAIGPVIGGVFAATLGWRAIFWFLTVVGGVALALLVVGLPETLRALVGNGSAPATGFAVSPAAWLQQRRRRKGDVEKDGSNSTAETPPAPAAQKKVKIDVLGPLLILFQLQATFSILFTGLYYMVWQMILTILSTLLKETYALSDLQIGLVFLANGGGCMLGTFLTGRFLDYDYKRTAARYTGPPEAFPLETARLRTVWLYGALQVAATLVFGWTLDKAISVAVPIVCLFVLGWTAISIQSVVSTLLVDIYHSRSASATAALNLVRCLLGAAGTSAILPCVSAIGVGWSFTLFALVLLAAFALVGLQMTVGRRRRLRQGG